MRSCGPMSNSQASKAMRYQDNIKCGTPHCIFNSCAPLITNWVVPIALLDAHKFWMRLLPDRLPMLRPRISDARKNKNGCGQGGLLCEWANVKTKWTCAFRSPARMQLSSAHLMTKPQTPSSSPLTGGEQRSFPVKGRLGGACSLLFSHRESLTLCHSYLTLCFLNGQHSLLLLQ